jgi:hypothetical protein
MRRSINDTLLCFVRFRRRRNLGTAFFERFEGVSAINEVCMGVYGSFLPRSRFLDAAGLFFTAGSGPSLL